MNRTVIIGIILLVGLVAGLSGCGNDEKKIESIAAGYLPEVSQRVDLKQSSEIRIYTGESLWEYINGGAEVYLLYGFREVATVDYSSEDINIVADIYRFDTPVNAYGLYSTMRPDNAETVGLGVEGFIDPGTINFVRGDILVRLVGYEDTDESHIALINLAEEINTLIPGIATRPAAFALFPAENRIALTDKYYAELFLGQRFLTEVYSLGFDIRSDSLTLFLTTDSLGGKFLEWRNYATRLKTTREASADIPYDEEYGFIIDNNFHGQIVVGLKNGRLLGMTNYSQKHKDFLIDWINSLP